MGLSFAVEMLNQPIELLAGREFRFSGTLEVSIADVDLNQALLRFSNGKTLRIIDTGFVRRCCDGVPGYVGGRFLLRDPVELSGALGVEDGEPVITKVHSGTLWRQDEGPYELPP